LKKDSAKAEEPSVRSKLKVLDLERKILERGMDPYSPPRFHYSAQHQKKGEKKKAIRLRNIEVHDTSPKGEISIYGGRRERAAGVRGIPNLKGKKEKEEGTEGGSAEKNPVSRKEKSALRQGNRTAC